MRQVKQTLLDVRFYLIFLWAVMVCITSVVTFGSIGTHTARWVGNNSSSRILTALVLATPVISGFGFDAFKTLLIGLPGPGLQLVTIWVSLGADRRSRRSCRMLTSLRFLDWRHCDLLPPEPPRLHPTRSLARPAHGRGDDARSPVQRKVGAHRRL
jgi:hypothetical protein